MTGLKLKLLGQMECTLETKSGASRLTLSTRKAEVLLAYLALAPDICHPRDRLFNLLWSNRSEQQARNSLRQALSAIKKSLKTIDPGPLQIERTTVLLDSNLIKVDALEFIQLADSSDTESLGHAAALYRGEFLEGVSVRDNASEE